LKEEKKAKIDREKREKKTDADERRG